MKLPRSVKAFGSPEFKTILTAELAANSGDIPLKNLLGKGGQIAEIAGVFLEGRPTHDDYEIVVKISVLFDESTPSSYSEMELITPNRAEFTIRINKETDIVDFKLEGHGNLSFNEDFAGKSDYGYSNSQF